MRAIIRFSVDRENNGVVRNRLKKILTSAGFVLKENTATYEHSAISPDDVASVMKDFWTLAADPKKGGARTTPASLDHVWTYVDEPPAASGNGQTASKV